MTKPSQHWRWISRARPLAGSGALVFAATLAAVLVAASAAPAQTFKILYAFAGSSDGANPTASLIQDASGNLYGTTFSGGAFKHGTVFKLDTNGTETVLHSFTGLTDGINPLGGVLMDAAGNLYGTTLYGGAANSGTVFKLDTAGKETVLHSFRGSDGASPSAGLVQDATGNLYGTTYAGGAGAGTVFKLDTNGTETVLYSFPRWAGHGQQPQAGVVLDASGNIYGTTYHCMAGHNKDCTPNRKGKDNCGEGCGVLFRLDTAGQETVLHFFSGHGSDGAFPHADLAWDAEGNLYTTTEYGGSGSCTLGCGTVFKLDQSGKKPRGIILHSFTAHKDGAYPSASVVRDVSGNLYGTTQVGGLADSGTVFEITPNGTETVLYTFQGKKDGRYPQAGLLQDAAGNLYGTASEGGAYGYGVVFELTP